MTDKTLAKAIVICLVAAIGVALFEESLGIETADNLYMVAGIGFYVFGGMAAYRLNK